MYIIDQTYFQGLVPLLDEANSSTLTELGQLCDVFGRSLLKKALGYVLWKDFDSFLVNGMFPTDTTGIPQKWINLVNGCEYNNSNGDLRKWNGLIYTEGVTKYSLLTPYVYYHYLVQNVSYVSGVGEVKSEAKNAVSVNSTQKSVKVWNDFVSMYQGDWCLDRTGIFYFHNNVLISDFYGGTAENDIVSLLTFLRDNPDDYPKARMEREELKNQFGL